jgi:hypothetical protein
MNDVLRKLTSRKFILALIGMAIGAGMALGVDGNEIVDMVTLISGVLTALGSAIAYINGEAKVDAAAAAAPQIIIPKGGEYE